MLAVVKSFSLSAIALAVSVGPYVAHADAGIEYQYGNKLKVTGVNAIVGIEEPMTAPGDNCSQRIADVVIDEVVYDGASDMVAGFRAKKPAPREWYGIFRIDTDALYKSIPNAAHNDVLKLIKKGASIIVTYQVCGSGGFVSVRDIYKKTAVNNP